MSRINFDILAKQYPKLEPVWTQLDDWFKKAQLKTVDPARVARELGNIRSDLLAEAFSLLVKEGWLTLKYRLESPNGVFEGPVFDDPNQIPEEVPGRFEQPIITESCRIVPVFRETEKARPLQ